MSETAFPLYNSYPNIPILGSGSLILSLQIGSRFRTGNALTILLNQNQDVNERNQLNPTIVDKKMYMSRTVSNRVIGDDPSLARSPWSLFRN